MAKKQKLELVWPGKDERPKLEPRILIEDPEKSYHAKERQSENDTFDNMLIHGDNLLALKALESDARVCGQVKCVYIDPPFNTGAAFEHYDDGIEHSVWLDLMRERLQIIQRLLASDAVVWIHIDDKEMAYLRVLCDEVFGRRNFLNMIVVKTSDPSGHKTVNPSPYSQTEYILMYSNDREKYSYDQRYVEATYDPGYNQYITNVDEHYQNWEVVGLNQFVASSLDCSTTREARQRFGRVGFDAQVAQFALQNANAVFQPTAISNVAGRGIVELREQSKSEPERVFRYERDDYDDVYIRNGRQVYFYSSKIREIDGELVPAKPLTNLWADIPYNGIAREGGVEFKNGKKPEKLVWRCIELVTKPGDLVLDSFAGSGTTGAVAQKMGRRWIMVELGEHANTHIVPRLQKAIDGEDKGGVTEATGWKGGGGFRFYNLAPSLLKEDKYGRWVISDDYNPEMLAEALCKHMGFTYAPSQEADEYWNHGFSTETDFIYVTTQTLTHDACKRIAEDVGPDRSLLICCKAFNADVSRFDNLTLVKIPTAILSKCEWGRDDYSLNVANLPMAEQDNEESVDDLPLFGGDAAEGSDA